MDDWNLMGVRCHRNAMHMTHGCDAHYWNEFADSEASSNVV
jgi:hypothetical protein